MSANGRSPVPPAARITSAPREDAPLTCFALGEAKVIPDKLEFLLVSVEPHKPFFIRGDVFLEFRKVLIPHVEVDIVTECMVSCRNAMSKCC